VYQLLSSSTSPFFFETDHHDTLPELRNVVDEGSKLLGEILRTPLMAQVMGGNNLIVTKHFKAWTYIQVEVLLHIPSGSSMLSCPCREDFIDSCWS